MQTNLTLSMGGLPPLSARGCTQELKPMPQGEFRRTIDGELLFIGNPEHKYYSTIRCDDKSVLATEGLAIGEVVSVGCIQKLCQKITPSLTEQTVVLERNYVSHSVYGVDECNQPYQMFKLHDREVILAPLEKPIFIFYSPLLEMRVVAFKLTTDEWNRKSTWQLELEEI